MFITTRFVLTTPILYSFNRKRRLTFWGKNIILGVNKLTECLVMSVTEQLFDGVVIKPEYEGIENHTEYNTKRGFLETGYSALQDVGRVTLLGFGVSGWQHGTTELADAFEPITSPFRLPPATVTLARQVKGIGARMYNTAQALAATADQPSEIGMYAFSVDPTYVWDKRRSIDHTPMGKFLRVGQHGWLKFAEVCLGTGNVIHVVDTKLGEAEAVLYNQTPSGERQKRKNQAEASVIPEEMMVVRRKLTKLIKVGDYTAR